MIRNAALFSSLRGLWDGDYTLTRLVLLLCSVYGVGCGQHDGDYILTRLVLLLCSVHGVGRGQHDGAGVCVAHTSQPARVHCVCRLQTLHPLGCQTQPAKSPHHVSSTATFFCFCFCFCFVFDTITLSDAC